MPSRTKTSTMERLIVSVFILSRVAATVSTNKNVWNNMGASLPVQHMLVNPRTEVLRLVLTSMEERTAVQ